MLVHHNGRRYIMDKLIETINDMHDLLRNMEMDKWEDLEAESETFDNHLKSMHKAIDERAC